MLNNSIPAPVTARFRRPRTFAWRTFGLAHLFIEYSANLRERLDLPAFVGAVHQAALDTEIFPPGGLRTRAYETSAYCIADGHPDNAFVHIWIRVGHGRDVPTRRAACEKIFAAACGQLEALFAAMPLGLSLEMQEIDPQFSLKKNNLHDYVKSRRSRPAAPAS